MCMYVTMRVTRTLWAAILLHGLTDPTTFLSTGGLDQAVKTTGNGWTALSGFATILLIAFGVIAVFLTRGKAARLGPAGAVDETTPTRRPVR